MNGTTAPMLIPVAGAILLLAAVTLDATAPVRSGAGARLGRLSGSVILGMTAAALLIMLVDYSWSIGVLP